MPRPLAVLAAVLALAVSARAEYILADQIDGRAFILDAWDLSYESLAVCTEEQVTVHEAWALTFTRDGVDHRIPVNLFWLADRIDSDSICCGDHEAEMHTFLKALDEAGAKKDARPALVVELSATRGSGFFVSGLWTYDREAAWTRAKEHGSPLFGLKPEDARAAESAEAYEKKIRAVAEESWKKGLKPRGEPKGEGAK